MPDNADVPKPGPNEVQPDAQVSKVGIPSEPRRSLFGIKEIGQRFMPGMRTTLPLKPSAEQVKSLQDLANPTPSPDSPTVSWVKTGTGSEGKDMDHKRLLGDDSQLSEDWNKPGVASQKPTDNKDTK